MPIYEFDCPRCGSFDALLPMREREAPRPCPGCGTPAPRRLSAPRLALMPHARRQAHVTNERSAHEPKQRHGCGHAPRERDTRPRAGRGRPWMLGH
ncbi:FmdB family zinc ribbon protein [Halomonas sp. 328]|uniref:FmdB family zinc ribbon protein n=1 Tax=Halomonas sp. 328 TaxID=2776704 RepID=UPI0018A77A20|nr:zinc ribbon domain-containing protein [Halomonas sp. 328]MBF8221546.1 zinc ribbon domain-containing protein [Halomonas sp. 328]